MLIGLYVPFFNWYTVATFGSFVDFDPILCIIICAVFGVANENPNAVTIINTTAQSFYILIEMFSYCSFLFRSFSLSLYLCILFL